MERRLPKLGLWWVGALLSLAGLAVFVIADRGLVGGLLMASGFAAWALLRFLLRDRPVGALAVRSIAFDLVIQVTLAVNVAGAVLLTLRRTDWRPLAVLDTALVVVAVVLIRRERLELRARRERRDRRRR